MVRLKLKGVKKMKYQWFQSLNSTMVRLKQIFINKQNERYVSLNSTMVRLKQETPIRKNEPLHKSQFHYGSIKT